MMKHIELCVALEKPKLVREALYFYRTLTQQVRKEGEREFGCCIGFGRVDILWVDEMKYCVAFVYIGKEFGFSSCSAVCSCCWVVSRVLVSS